MKFKEIVHERLYMRLLTISITVCVLCAFIVAPTVANSELTCFTEKQMDDVANGLSQANADPSIMADYKIDPNIAKDVKNWRIGRTISAFVVETALLVGGILMFKMLGLGKAYPEPVVYDIVDKWAIPGLLMAVVGALLLLLSTISFFSRLFTKSEIPDEITEDFDWYGKTIEMKKCHNDVNAWLDKTRKLDLSKEQIESLNKEAIDLLNLLKSESEKFTPSTKKKVGQWFASVFTGLFYDLDYEDDKVDKAVKYLNKLSEKVGKRMSYLTVASDSDNGGIDLGLLCGVRAFLSEIENYDYSTATDEELSKWLSDKIAEGNAWSDSLNERRNVCDTHHYKYDKEVMYATSDLLNSTLETLDSIKKNGKTVGLVLNAMKYNRQVKYFSDSEHQSDYDRSLSKLNSEGLIPDDKLTKSKDIIRKAYYSSKDIKSNLEGHKNEYSNSPEVNADVNLALKLIEETISISEPALNNKNLS